MKVRLGSVVAAASGSVGGCTYSHNRYGPYVRQRVVPVNPASAQQGVVRSRFAALATAWNVDLDQSERDGWNAYAAAVPRIDALGNAVYVTGLNWFVAVNSVRLQCALARLDEAPVLHNHTELSACTITTTSAPNTASIAFANTDEWAGETGGVLSIAFSQATNETRTFFKGPFRWAEKVLGAATPPTSPKSCTTPFAFALGQRLWSRIIACSSDGRLSVPQTVSIVAV